MKRLIQNKGQGTIEYLVILGVVLLIGLLAAPYALNLFNNQADIGNEQQSKMYWQNTARPFTIPDFEINPTSATIVLQNNDSQDLNISMLRVNNVDFNQTGVLISAGQKKSFTASSLGCTAGQKFSYKVRITYSTPDISDRNQARDDTPLVGNCSS